MMVTVVALFAVCWAPFHIVHMMIEYSECFSFSFDRSFSLFPARMDNVMNHRNLLLFTWVIKYQTFCGFLSCFQDPRSLHGR